MSKINEGGQAFPTHPILYSSADAANALGMSLRDYFAAQALLSMGTWMPDFNADGQRAPYVMHLSNPEALKARSEWAYAQADAMIAAREKSNAQD